MTEAEAGGKWEMGFIPRCCCQIDIFHFRLKTTKTARLFVLTAAGIPALSITVDVTHFPLCPLPPLSFFTRCLPLTLNMAAAMQAGCVISSRPAHLNFI